MKYFEVTISFKATRYLQAKDEREARVAAFAAFDPQNKLTPTHVVVKEIGVTK